MLQALERERSLRDRVITSEPTPRVETLRQRYLDTQYHYVIDILRIMTRVMKETEGEPIVSRRAKAFAEIVNGVPVNIYPDEPFVGWLFSEPGGEDIRETQLLRMEQVLETIATGKGGLRDHRRELKEEIIPYWKSHRGVFSLPPEVAASGLWGRSGTRQVIGERFLAHFVVNYEKVLKRGLVAIKQDAEDRLERIDYAVPGDLKKVPFLQAVIGALDAASGIGARFAAKARELAGKEANPARKEELLEIADVCDQVPARPARTFREALQSIWFVHMMLAWEVSFVGGTSPGRVDQYLYPFYERDIREGRITEESAQELLDCWCMRFSQHVYQGPSHPTPGHHLDIGGLKGDGGDATNDLSYMFIEAMMHTPGMVEPTLSLLVHSKTPDSLLIKAVQLTAMGGGYPMYLNHDLMVENLLARYANSPGAPALTLAVARQYAGGAGCHEPTLSTMDSGWMPAWDSRTLVKALELVFTNGKRPSDGRRVGEETGDPASFPSFEEFRQAYVKQLSRLIRLKTIARNLDDLQALQPSAFTSALVEDCIENGVAKEEGGARYNAGTPEHLMGSVDVGNSLAAIKKLVFDDKKVTLPQLIEALDHNFEGYEKLHKWCSEAPKFGNDEDAVDEQVAWVIHAVAEEAGKYTNVYGGRNCAYHIPWAGFIPVGEATGALPSGRKAGEPLADGISPNMGTDLNGPTSVLKSVGKINNGGDATLGQSLNMKIDPTVFEKDDGFKRLADLIRVFVDQKVDHVQINIASVDTLRAAQEEPEKYRDLTVKVAGYNARFVTIHKELQDQIISRTEHGLGGQG